MQATGCSEQNSQESLYSNLSILHSGAVHLCGGTGYKMNIQVVGRTSIVLVFLIAGGSMVSAQNLSSTDGPAEAPASSFVGNQYVDSQGCVFIRAGFGGNVVWVPRVTRNRTLLCGFAPSVAASETPAAAATTSRPTTTTPPKMVAVAARPPVVRTQSVATSAPVAVRHSAAPKPMANGFRAAWDDGRLNQQRGPRTAAGDAQMALIWTNTVPRKLVKAGN